MTDKKKFIIIFLFLSGSVFILNADPYLYGEFVYNLNLDLRSNPFPGIEIEDFEEIPGEEYEREVIEKLLEEARWVFSAMIYGLKVDYTPSDISRSVDRFYEAELLAEIPYGDPGLEVYDTFLENKQFHLFLRYRPDVYQEKRIEYWDSGIFDSSAAAGEYPLFQEDSRINAVKEAIRIALENQLKADVYNKPSMIEAEVLLRESPLFSIVSGSNRAFVRLRTNIKNVRHYRVNN